MEGYIFEYYMKQLDVTWLYMSQSKHVVLTNIRNVLLNQQNVIMGLTQSIYEWWHSVECHFDERCTYQRGRETNKIRYWIRRCVCKRNMPEVEVPQNLNTDLRKETKFGGGERWFELSWIHYPGPNLTSLAG